MKPYPIELRQRVFDKYNNNKTSMKKVGEDFTVSTSFVNSLIQNQRDTGNLEPKPHGGGRSTAVDENGREYIRGLLDKESDLTLSELCQRYYDEFKKDISTSSMDRTLAKMKITRKKKTTYAPEKNSPENIKKTEDYHEVLNSINKEDVIFIDETGSSLNMTPTHGRSPKGERAFGEKPTSTGRRISTIGAISCLGMETALSFEGTLNGDLFLFFVEVFLLPKLRTGHVVILDNCSVHHVDGIEELINSTGARLVFLPPYSPELNPIELAWSKVKNFLRKAKARTAESLYQAIGAALETITWSDADGWFDHAGVYS